MDGGGGRWGVAWSWPDAVRGLVYALPALVVTAIDPATGVPLAVGVLPACLVPLPGPRRARALLAVVGGLCAAALLAGGVLVHLPTVGTAVGLAAVVLAAAVAASARPTGRLALVLAAPLTAIGLSYGDWSTSLAAAALMVAGSTYAWLASLPWPARPAASRPTPELPARAAMVRYGLLVGCGAAIAYLVAAALGTDHPGWAPAACLLVARPDPALLLTRAVGRALAVTAGALAAVAVLRAGLPSPVLAVLVALAVCAVAATRGSRWYITSAFTTVLVFVMLLHDHPEQTGQKVGERVVETLVGVGLALLFGIWLPALAARGTARGGDREGLRG